MYLVYEMLGESRDNRTADEYIAIAKRIPSVVACHAYVNQRLAEIARSGREPYRINYSKAGWKGPEKPFPTSVSLETVRTALKVHGVRLLQQLETV